MELRARTAGVPYDQTLAARAHAALITKGASSMFSPPAQTLDPALFTGQHIRLDVARTVMRVGTDFLSQRYRDVHRWARFDLAGSAITYRWVADREPRDLDCLVGVDFIAFRVTNPLYAEAGDDAIANMLNKIMHEQLWPSTADFPLGGSRFELTYYCNPGGTDVRDIHPYAAYDLHDGRWVVTPQDTERVTLSPEWTAALHRELADGRALVRAWDEALAMRALTAGERRNREVALVGAASRAKALYDSIHGDRHLAFNAATGHGYADWWNVRWQWQKGSGLVPALLKISKQVDEAAAAADAALYGALPDVETAAVYVPPAQHGTVTSWLAT